MKIQIFKATLLLLTIVSVKLAAASPLENSPLNGTYTTSLLTNLNSYIGDYKGETYFRGDFENFYRPTIEIRKDPRDEIYGYTLTINIPCGTKKIPFVYSINYNGNNIILSKEGHSQCSIQDNFKIHMHRSLDMVDGTFGTPHLSLDLGYRSPTYPYGMILFNFVTQN